VIAQIDGLNKCLDLISWKVTVYEKRLAQGTASDLWTASGSDNGEEPQAARLLDERSTEEVHLRTLLERHATANLENVWNGRPISKILLADPLRVLDATPVPSSSSSHRSTSASTGWASSISESSWARTSTRSRGSTAPP